MISINVFSRNRNFRNSMCVSWFCSGQLTTPFSKTDGETTQSVTSDGKIFRDF